MYVIFLSLVHFYGDEAPKNGETKLKKTLIFGNFTTTENKIKRRAFYF